MLYDKTYSYGDSSGLSPDSLFIRPRLFCALQTQHSFLSAETDTKCKGTAAKHPKYGDIQKIMKKFLTGRKYRNIQNANPIRFIKV